MEKEIRENLIKGGFVRADDIEEMFEVYIEPYIQQREREAVMGFVEWTLKNYENADVYVDEEIEAYLQTLEDKTSILTKNLHKYMKTDKNIEEQLNKFWWYDGEVHYEDMFKYSKWLVNDVINKLGEEPLYLGVNFDDRWIETYLQSLKNKK